MLSLISGIGPDHAAATFLCEPHAQPWRAGKMTRTHAHGMYGPTCCLREFPRIQMRPDC
jgi:hypothetical protein